MESLYQHFAHVLERHYQSRASHCSNGKLVLAFSGGIDSRVLLELLRHYQHTHSVPCQAVYVHHGLSDNADVWADKCLHWAKQAGIPCMIEYVNLDIHSGESIELLARQARYKALQQYIEQGDILLTGQHADDQVETLLLALKRGSGPKGLSSMPESMPFAKGSLVRPLLTIQRQHIERFAQQFCLEWVEDESNQDTRYDRNFLRHRVIPQLVQRWPSFHQAVQRSAHLCAEQEQLLDELLDSAFQQAIHPDGSLCLSILSTHSALVRLRLIRMWLSMMEVMMPSRIQLGLIWSEVALAQQDANPKLQLKQGEIRRFQNRLYWLGPRTDLTDWYASLQLDIPLLLPDSLGELLFSSTSEQANLILPEEPDLLKVTFNPEGLSAHPTTRSRGRKLKKLFQEYHIPSWQRRQLPIVMYQGQVVAVAGLFVDRAFSGHQCELIWHQSDSVRLINEP